MGRVVMGAISPHPPIIIEAVGGSERELARGTIDGLEALARDLVATKARTLVIISPHGPVFEDGIVIRGGERLGGDLADFQAPEVRLEYINDLELAGKIAECAREKGIFTAVAGGSEARRFGLKPELDHGVMVPLDHFHRAGFQGKLVVMGMALFTPDVLYKFGMAIQQAIEDSAEEVAVIASGDLSHRLSPDAPAGYNKRGQEFDRELVERFRQGDFAGIMDLDSELIETAGECGYRPINILLGALDRYLGQTKVYSYEGPYGVGYLVGGIFPGEETGEPGAVLKDYLERRSRRLTRVREQQHPLVTLAYRSLEHYLNTGEYLADYQQLPLEFRGRAGVFVSLKKHGRLRGCIGTIAPTQPDVAREVIHNAVSAGTEDPRFEPVERQELPELTLSVDVLGEEEKISGPELLDPQRFGVIVRQGNRSGLLLPNLAGIDSVEDQVSIARQKAGIGLGDEVELSRFEVKRFY